MAGVRAALWLLLVVFAAPAPARAEPLPLFDAHIHYSEPDWSVIPPERALAILKSANVRRAIVSSTPDDGTLRLWEKDPALVVPFLRPYRTRADMGSWPRDPGVAAYVEARLARGVYKGIGEFHLSADDVEAPVVRRVAELAARHDLFLMAHVDDVAVDRLLTVYPGVKILWAHAGMSAPAGTVGRLVDRFPRLWVELSLRPDVAPGGPLDPEWRALFVRHPDRFQVGTDTRVTSQWQALPDWLAGVQGWLAQLPREVAERIAFRNGQRLFGGP
jgi:hypothetical protein